MTALIEAIISILTFIPNTYLGLFIFLRNKNSWTNRLFFLLAFWIDVYIIVNYLSLHPPLGTPENQLFWIRVVMFITSFIGPTLLLLAHTFPADKITLPKWKLVVLILFCLTSATLSLLPFVFTNITYPGGMATPTPGPGMPIFFADFHGIFLLSFFVLLKKYRHSQGLAKLQYLYFVIGVIITFTVMAVATNLLVAVFKFSGAVFLGPISVLVLLTLLAYAIVKHRFLDMSLLVARAVNYTLLVLIIAGLYAYSLFLIPSFLPPAWQTPTEIILALVLAFTFNPLRKIIELATEDIFHKRAYSSEKLLNTLGDITSSTLSLSELTEKVLHELTETIHATKAGFFLLIGADHHRKIEVVGHGYPTTTHLTPADLHSLSETAHNLPLVFEELEEGPTKKLLRDHQISIALPLQLKDTFHGFLVLGEKASGDIYTSQDINVLDIFMPQISVAIQNSLAFRKISRFNITLKKRVNEATADLKKANRHLIHLDKLKDEFVFIATHELKTPVTVIKGYLSMINDHTYGDIPEKLSPALNEVGIATTQLVQLVNDLLEIARSEAKTLKISTVPTEIFSLITQVVNNLHSLADQKGLKLEYHTLPGQGVKVFADPERIKEIVNNLVSNAIKYSNTGTITVSHESDGENLITHVADQGVGISAEDQTKMFTRFFRAQETAQVPGTGLGLFIVKQIVEKMGGKIWLKSKLSEGTTFSFSLPLAKHETKEKSEPNHQT